MHFTATVSLALISGISALPHKGVYRDAVLPGGLLGGLPGVLPGQPFPLGGVAGFGLPVPGMVKVTSGGQTFMLDVPPHIMQMAAANKDATIPLAYLPPHMFAYFPNGLPAKLVEAQPAGAFPGLPGLPPPPPGFPGLIPGLPGLPPPPPGFLPGVLPFGAPVPGVVPVAGAVVASPNTNTKTINTDLLKATKGVNGLGKRSDNKVAHKTLVQEKPYTFEDSFIDDLFDAEDVVDPDRVLTAIPTTSRHRNLLPGFISRLFRA